MRQITQLIISLSIKQQKIRNKKWLLSRDRNFLVETNNVNVFMGSKTYKEESMWVGPVHLTFCTECVKNLDRHSKMIILKSLLTTSEVSVGFWDLGPLGRCYKHFWTPSLGV